MSRDGAQIFTDIDAGSAAGRFASTSPRSSR